MPYLPVSDLDQAGRSAVELGATVIRDRVDLPQGSLMVFTDPGGATVALWQEAGQ